MKAKFLLTILCFLFIQHSWATINQTTSKGGSIKVILSHQNPGKPIRLSEPNVIFDTCNCSVTIDFGNQPHQYSPTWQVGSNTYNAINRYYYNIHINN